MGVPTHGESFALLIHHIREAQSQAAMLCHLCRANGDGLQADGWLKAEDNFAKMVIVLTMLATGRLQ